MKVFIATISLVIFSGAFNSASAMSCAGVLGGVPEGVRSLDALAEAAKKKTSSEAATSRTEFVESAMRTRTEVFESPAKTAIEDYNAAILKAAFVQFKKEGWAWANPFVKRESLLDAKKAFELLIFDGASFPALAHD